MVVQPDLSLTCAEVPKTGFLVMPFISKLTKVSNFSDTNKPYCKHSKIQTKRFYLSVIPPNDAVGIKNSADPDQTALL